MSLNLRNTLVYLCLVTLAAGAVPPARATVQATTPRLVIVFVVDGLRPDSINAEDTPNMDRLRREGIHYLNSHCVFPSVTRVNAASISTGMYPDKHGLVSNSMFHPGVYPNKALNTGEWRDLMKLAQASNGRLLFSRSLDERLREKGIRYAAVSSGSTGNALLLNDKAPSTGGFVINGNFDPGKRVAFPDAVNDEILKRFGKAPTEEGSPLVDWTDRILREYVLPEYKPQVVINWLTEPDGAQHKFGVGSKEARAALSNSDRSIGLTLAKIVELGLGDSTDVFVLSDHGFSWLNEGVNLSQELLRAGLKARADSDDLVIASNGQSVLLHFKNKDRAQILKTIAFLEKQKWVDLIFTALKPLPAGTFSLESIHAANPERGPDILFTLPWSSAADPLGRAGTHYAANSAASGPMTGSASGHGGISPWTVRNTMVLWGKDFKRNVATRVASSNVDVAPTILRLVGLAPASEMDGRVLEEALVGGPDPEQVVSQTVIEQAVTDGSESYLQVTTVGKQRYIDKGWRQRSAAKR